ncbi:MAG: hypothetical protein AAF602_05495 [Myxococcota bacterium]
MLAVMMWMGCTETTEPGTTPDDPDRIAMRDAILAEAERARGACDGDDNDPAVRASLSAAIDELVAATEPETEAEKLSRVVGVWDQVWSDTPFTDFEGICFVGDRIFQVVFEDQFYYNLAQVEAFGMSSRSFVRGEFDVLPDVLDVTFTGGFVASGEIGDTAEALRAEAVAAESGEIEQLPVPGFIEAGTPGRLRNYYVDDVLRVITDGSSATESDGIFITRRVPEPAP